MYIQEKENQEQEAIDSQKECGIEGDLEFLDLSDEEAICPKCGISSAYVNDLWISCDSRGKWFDFKCIKIKRKKT